MVFTILWIICTIVCEIIYHTVFHVYYVGQDGCLQEIARSAAVGLFMAMLILNFIAKHPLLIIIIVVVVIALIVAKKSQT